MVAEGRAEQRRRGRVADQRVTRCGAGSLAEPVDDPAREDPAPMRRSGDQDAPHGRPAVAPADPRQAPLAPTVREPSGEPAQADGDPLRHALDHADRRNRRSERHREKQRHNRVGELAGGVVRERDPAQRADVARQRQTGTPSLGQSLHRPYSSG